MTDVVREHLQAQIFNNRMQLRQLAEDMADPIGVRAKFGSYRP